MYPRAGISTVILFCFILAGLAAPSVEGMTGSLSDEATYVVTIDRDNDRLLKVKALFYLHDNVLYMSENGAGQFAERWAKFVRNLQVSDSNGKPLNIKQLPGAKWEIDAPIDQKVLLEYDVTLEHEKHRWAGGIDGAAFRKDWGVFYTGRSFLIMNGKERSNIGLKFNLPPKWHISGSWDLTKQNTFTARNLTALSESMFFAGTHKEFVLKRDGFELLFALGGDGIIAEKEALRKLAEGVLDYYIDIMGGIPNPPPDNKFRKSLVIINSGDEMDGEVVGNHISMIFNPDGDQQSQTISRFIFAHEFFHLWNGKSIRPANTTEDWFKEGVTSYYTLKALRHVGFINNEAFFGILNNLFYQRYRTDKGYGKLSMRDVASGFSKDNHWGLIYGGGLFAGLCQDIAIRKASVSKKSLDDLMRGYFNQYGGTNATYSTKDLKDSLTKLNGKNQNDFFKRYIVGAEPIPITECLSTAGLNAEIENGQMRISADPRSTDLQKSIQKGVLGN